MASTGCEAVRPPDPAAAARAYAASWSELAYTELYERLTPAAQESIDRATFVSRYERIAVEMTLAAVEASVLEVLAVLDERGREDPARREALLRAVFRTARVGDFEREIVLPLERQEDLSWRVAWTSAAIVPELVEDRLVRMTLLPTSRGRIVARDGTELATFGDGVIVGVVPGQIQDEPAFLASLAPLVRLSEGELRARYQGGQPDWFMPVRTLGPDTPPEVLERLRVIEGVLLQATRVRAYPQGALAAHLVGYVGEITAEELERFRGRGYRAGDLVGKTGLEATLEEVLAGAPGWRLGVVERDERPVATLAEQPPTPGLDVVLSIDPAAQRAAEAALSEEAKGAVVLIDAASGEVLALASWPSYDPNAFVFDDRAAVQRYVADEARPLFSRATHGQYPTGSAFKPITAVAALREGVLRAGERVPCPAVWTGYGERWRQLNHETGDLGPIDLRTAMARSCNTVFYELGKRLNDRDPLLLPETAMSFGLGRATDVDFVFEEAGLVPTPEWKRQALPNDPVWLPGDATNLAIGQGFLLVTPLQMANYGAAVLNGGTVHKPRIVLRFQHRDGTVERDFAPETIGQADVSPEHLALVRETMRAVVAEPQGTAYGPFLGFPVEVLGKSGTAETAAGAPNAWFVGGAVHAGALIAVAALVEEKPGLRGSQDAARIARAALAAALGVAP